MNYELRINFSAEGGSPPGEGRADRRLWRTIFNYQFSNNFSSKGGSSLGLGGQF
jgi:hypothetical protein